MKEDARSLDGSSTGSRHTNVPTGGPCASFQNSGGPPATTPYTKSLLGVFKVVWVSW